MKKLSLLILVAVLCTVGTPYVFASTCTLTWDGSNVHLTYTGYDNGGISSQGWSMNEAAFAGDTSGAIMNSGTAHGTDNVDFTAPVSNLVLPYSGSTFPGSANLATADGSIGNDGSAYSGWVVFNIHTTPSYTNNASCWVNEVVPSPTPSPATGTTTPNTYIFLLTGGIIFIGQLFAILVLLALVAAIVTWPVRLLIKKLRQIIRK